jgi:ABC-type glutathione transport system ATPase component
MDVGLTQKQLTVIADLDVDVLAGEVVAIVGASGSGKSLLAPEIACLCNGGDHKHCTSSSIAVLRAE